jgi:hypothetical protein
VNFFFRKNVEKKFCEKKVENKVTNIMRITLRIYSKEIKEDRYDKKTVKNKFPSMRTTLRIHFKEKELEDTSNEKKLKITSVREKL